MLAFSWIDHGIVAVYLIATIAMGVLASRFIKGMAGYLVAGRSLGTALSVAAMTGSELGLITVMYQAQKGFTGGFAALHIALAAGLVTVVVGLTGFIVVPLRRMGVMTIPEYYERRFGPRTRVLGGILLALGGILNMGLFLRVGSDFVIGVTGLEQGSGALIAVMIGLIAIVLFYTVLGGMVSVVLTEYVQFVVLSLGLMLSVFLAWNYFGWDTLVATVVDHRGAAGMDPMLTEGTGFGPAYITWQGVLGLVSCAIWPTAVTRALAARNTGVVRRQYTISAVSFTIRFLIPCFLGVCAFVYLVKAGATFFTSTDGQLVPMEAGGKPDAFALAGAMEPSNSIDALPLFIAQILPVGVLGLVTAAMLAAFMSTHSNYILCWASVLTRDVVTPMRRSGMSERSQLLLTRIFVLALGGYVVFWGLFYEPSQDVWEYLGVTGGIYFTGAISVLVGGLYWRRASSTGAVLAMLAGFTMLLGLGPVQDLFSRFTVFLGFRPVKDLLDAPTVGLATIGMAVLAMVVGSLVFPDKSHSEEVNS